MMIRRIPIKLILIFAFLISGLIPTLMISYVSYRTTRAEMKGQVFRQLESVRNIKKEQINNFFNERFADISTFSQDPTVIEACQHLMAVFKPGEKGFKGYSEEKFAAPDSYIAVHDRYFPFFKNLISNYGYYDLFLLSPEDGKTFFTVRKEADFGIQISKISSSLRDVWIKVVKDKKMALSDTKPYPPSDNIPAQFLAAPVLDNGEVKAVIAMQISIDSIDNIMKERSGLWQTGETYLVGQDKKMRSDSFLDKSNHSVLASFKGSIEENGVDTEASRQALSGIEGKQILVDYRKKQVLSAFMPIRQKDVRWALIAEVDEDEINRQISGALNPKIMILTAISLILLLLIATIISTFLNKEIKNIIFQLEKMIDNILQGKFQARVKPGHVSVDFQGVIIRTNELLDTLVRQIEEKRKLEERILQTQRLEALGTLAGGIAHDFNNILTTMYVQAAIVIDKLPESGVPYEKMKELILSIRQATELVEQILAFSGEVKTNMIPIDVSKEIEENLKLFKTTLPRNIRVQRDLYSEELLVMANPSKIRQVIVNLYTNACQAMKEGGLLTISTTKVKLRDGVVLGLKSGDYCTIRVTDTGHGIDTGTQEHIFEPFFTTRSEGEGTGMGLSVVFGIVKLYGGAIEVDSNPGKGSSFTVYLPLANGYIS